MNENSVPPVDRSNRCTVGGMDPNTDEHRELKANGQQKDYVILCDEERAKGFVRPYRDAYRHVGVRPRFPLRDLTPEEIDRHRVQGYVKYEQYPESESRACGRYWTEKQLNSGCGQVTTMSRKIAETYARDPGFYGGTFCSTCMAHFPVGPNGEFEWLDGTKVGS